MPVVYAATANRNKFRRSLRLTTVLQNPTTIRYFEDAAAAMRLAMAG